MKTLLLLTLLILLVGSSVKAGWELDATLSRNVFQHSYQPRIATSSSAVYVAWSETSDTTGADQVYVSRFNGTLTNLGDSLNNSITVNAYVYSIICKNNQPCIATYEPCWAYGSKLHVREYTGSNWTQYAGNITDPARSPLQWASISYNTDMYITFPEAVFVSLPSFYMWSTVVKKYNGSNWNQIGGILNINAIDACDVPDIAFASNIPYVAWKENNDIRIKYFNGSSWNDNAGAIDLYPSSYSTFCRLAVSADNIPHVAWVEDGELYVKKYNGSEWVVLPGGSAGSSVGYRDMAFVFDGLTPYVAYSSNTKIYIKYHDGSTWLNKGLAANVDQSRDAHSVSLAFLNGTPYVAFREQNSSGYYKVHLKHYVQDAPTPTVTATPTITVTPTISATATISATITTANSIFDISKNDLVYAAPNPIRGATANIHVNCRKRALVTLKIFTPTNHEVLSLSKFLPQGKNIEKLNMANLANGVYLIYAKFVFDDGASETTIKKIALVK